MTRWWLMVLATVGCGARDTGSVPRADPYTQRSDPTTTPEPRPVPPRVPDHSPPIVFRYVVERAYVKPDACNHFAFAGYFELGSSRWKEVDSVRIGCGEPNPSIELASDSGDYVVRGDSLSFSCDCDPGRRQPWSVGVRRLDSLFMTAQGDGGMMVYVRAH